MRELIVASQGELHSNTKSLDGHDRDGANGGANRDKNERILLPVHRCYPVNHYGREDGHCKTVTKEPWLQSVVEEFVNSFDGLVRRRMENNDDRSKQTHGTTQLAQYAQPFLEEIRPENGTMARKKKKKKQTVSDQDTSKCTIRNLA